jgi:Protein of unknown function (DUF3352)
MRKLLLTIAVLSMPVLAAAGCGGDEQAASSAAELVPAGAVVYGEATLDPEGDQKEAIDNVLSKFPGGGGAGDKLKELIEKGFREGDVPVSFKKDIEPWLGDEAAAFAAGPAEAGQFKTAAAVVATDDEDAAFEALQKVDQGKAKKTTYRDVDFLDEPGDGAGATVDGFLVLGTEAGVKAAIDASKDGSNLSDDDDYTKAIEDASDDRLALLYVNTPELAKNIQGSGVALPESFDKFFKEPVVATVDADDDGVLIESTIPEQLAKTFAFFGKGSDLLTELPGDSWLALGQTDFGKLLDFYVDAFAGVAGGRDQIEQQFKAATGLEFQDVIAWMGDFGIFARGTSLSELDGALVVETSDEAASARFLAALERLAKTQADNPGDSVGPLTAPGGGKGFTLQSPDIPKPIHAFVKSGRVVIAYGDAAATDAVDPSDKLGDSADFTSTRDSLGDYDVSFYVLMAPILDLVDSTDSGTDADWQKAKPYLEPLSALVGGTSGDGDDLKSAVKLIVK